MFLLNFAGIEKEIVTCGEASSNGKAASGNIEASVRGRPVSSLASGGTRDACKGHAPWLPCFFLMKWFGKGQGVVKSGYNRANRTMRGATGEPAPSSGPFLSVCV